MNSWYGVTHLFPVWNWALKIWKHLFCSRGWHLFDETASIGVHELYCDACEFTIDLGIHSGGQDV